MNAVFQYNIEVPMWICILIYKRLEKNVLKLQLINNNIILLSIIRYDNKNLYCSFNQMFYWQTNIYLYSYIKGIVRVSRRSPTTASLVIWYIKRRKKELNRVLFNGRTDIFCWVARKRAFRCHVRPDSTQGRIFQFTEYRHDDDPYYNPYIYSIVSAWNFHLLIC